MPFTLGVLLLRRLPAVLALRRPLPLGWSESVYLGWFEPIGVAALFYLTMEADRLGVSDSVLTVGSLAVVASTVVHGVTAAPGRVGYERWAQRTQDRRATTGS